MPPSHDFTHIKDSFAVASPFPCIVYTAFFDPCNRNHAVPASALRPVNRRPLFFAHLVKRHRKRYCQVLCANSFTSLAELRLHRAEEPALDCPIAEGRVSVKGGEAACEALDVNSVFCYQPASSSCISMCFMLMYFFPPHWVPAT